MTKQDPPQRRKKSTFTNVGNVLNTLVSQLGLDRRIREEALMNLWPIVAGDTFSLNSRPLFVDYENNLVVAVRDASVAQELSLLKRQITNKLRSAGQSAGIRIEGLRLDMKHFHQDNQRAALFGSEGFAYLAAEKSAKKQATPEASELASMSLSSEETAELDLLKEKILNNGRLFLAEPSQQRIYDLSQRIGQIVERQLRTRKWQQSNGFPNCQECGSPAGRLHTKTGLCAYCYLRQNVQES